MNLFDGTDLLETTSTEIKNRILKPGQMLRAIDTGALYYGDKDGKPTAFVGASTSSSGGGVGLSVGIDKIPGKIPDDYEIMFARPVGPLTKVSVPNPYSAPPIAALHPGVLYVPTGFAGYTYLMAYTPMNASDSQWENPCICASNDPEKYGWELPAGAPNPLVQKPADAGYNSDTHLFWVSPTVLGMLYRARSTGIPTKNRFYVITTTDLVSWTAPVEIWSIATGSIDIASPSIWKDPILNKWVMVGHNVDSVNRDFVRITSNDLFSGWDATPTAITFPIPAPGRKWWHSWFTRLDSGRIVGFAMDNDGTLGNPGWIYVAQSYDNGFTFESCWIKGESNTELYYRASGWFIERNGAVEARVIYSYLSAPHMAVQTLQLRGSATRTAEFERLGSLLAIAGKMASRSLLIADDFNRADSATGLGTSLDGKTWTTDAPPNYVGIKNNMTYPVTAGNCIALFNVGVSGYSVMAVIGAVDLPAYILVNFKDSSKFLRVGNTASRFTIQKYFTTLAWQKTFDAASGPQIVYPVAGDIVRIDVSGQSAKIYLNGELMHTTNGDLIAGATKIGIQTAGATYTQWDAIAVSSF